MGHHHETLAYTQTFGTPIRDNFFGKKCKQLGVVLSRLLYKRGLR